MGSSWKRTAGSTTGSSSMRSRFIIGRGAP
jgi:hypothetical protein